MKRLAVLLALSPLLLAQEPTFLEHTLLPAQFTAAFSIYQLKEIKPPRTAPDNKLFYLDQTSTAYMKSFFAQSPLLPGSPIPFKNTPVWWYVVRDPSQGNAYTARVFALERKEWVLVAVNFGPPRRDMIARYYQHLTVPPVTAPPAAVPNGIPHPYQPAGVTVQWFYTSGHNAVGGKPPAVPQPDQGYFAMLTSTLVGPDGKQYRPPYSLVGKGTGAVHQAYGQMVYEPFNLNPQLTPADFTPPAGFRQVPSCEVKGGAVMIKENCGQCHYTEPGQKTELLEPCKGAAAH